MQAPGGPSEDPSGGFELGGWEMPFFDPASREEVEGLFGEEFDLLLGRKTYEIFAAYWPYYDGADHGGIARRFQEVKKHVVSRSGDVDTSWRGTVLLRDLAGVERLKREDGPDLLTQGSTELVHSLLARDLVDALCLFTVPVVLGRGKRLFADGAAPHTYELTRSRVSGKGVLIARYARGGAVETVDAAQAEPSRAEVTRRERVRREG